MFTYMFFPFVKRERRRESESERERKSARARARKSERASERERERERERARSRARQREPIFLRPTEFANNKRVNSATNNTNNHITRVQIRFLFSFLVQRGLLLTSCRMAATNTADVC